MITAVVILSLMFVFAVADAIQYRLSCASYRKKWMNEKSSHDMILRTAARWVEEGKGSYEAGKMDGFEDGYKKGREVLKKLEK